LSLIVLSFLWGIAAAQEVTTPEDFFGFQLGADGELARWDRIVEYFEYLDEQSERVQVQNLGPSTEGYPYLLVIVTSSENMDRLERLRQVNLRIQDPDTPEAEVRRLIDEGVAVVSQSFGLHSTEVAGAQTPPELAYDLVTRNDSETQRILDNTVMLMFPNFNPDGQIMVTDWYYENKGTEFEGVGLPWLYHKYVGHDNNRDADFLNMVEAQYTAKVLYKDWKPEAYVDHHQMGSYGARFYVPPYSEPIRPYADPIMWRELSWYGAHVAYKLEEDGRAGVLNAGQYPGWGHFGWHWITPLHNMAGMLTESASASLATPLYVHPDQLRGGARGLPEYEAQSNMPNPWPGGWWRLRDIVEQQKVAAWAIQDIAARNKETVLWNGYLKAKRQTERGAAGSPKSYVIPADQHDPVTMNKMIDTLLQSDIEIQVLDNAAQADGKLYAPGSYVVSLAQPKMGLIRNLLGQTFYPDNEWTRSRDGTPLRPYDTATHTMAEIMGVRVDAVDSAIDGGRLLQSPVSGAGSVDADANAYRLDGRQNASFEAINLLLSEGASVRRADSVTLGLHPGDFIVSQHPSIPGVADHTGVDFTALDSGSANAGHEVNRKRVAMYQRYRGGSMDEGWTRFVLEQFEFPYTTLHDDDITRGRLARSYDVIILPHDSPEMISGEEPDPSSGRSPTVYPEQYMSGLGDDGAEALREFVEGGGTVVAMGDASVYAIDTFELRVRNVVEDLGRKEFFSPGSTLRVHFDNSNPLGHGMPDDGLVLYWSNPVFEILPSRENDNYSTVVRYIDRDVLQSGWLIGEQHIAKKSAMVSAEIGDGQVILYGFRPQHRAQTHGTYKLFFNALMN
jgi:hypothetical protein